MSYSETTIVLYSINHIDKDGNTIGCLLYHYYGTTRILHEKFILELEGYINDILAAPVLYLETDRMLLCH